MKKLYIIILAALVGFASCMPAAPIKVTQVIDLLPSGKNPNNPSYMRYRVIATSVNGEYFTFLSDSLYQVGSIIIAK